MKGTFTRIIHFSDFHLSKSFESDAENLIASFISALMAIKAVRDVDFVIFTGDAVNRGGEGYSDLNEALNRFKEIVMLPITSALGLPPERFILTLGNHDQNFKADDMTKEEDLDQQLQTEGKINKFVTENQPEEHTKRMDVFKTFEQDYYKGMGDSFQPTRFQSNFLFEINGVKICITSLNSSWRCNDLPKGDINRIPIGTFQVLQSMKYLNDSQMKIAIAHHHPSFLVEDEKVTMQDVITNNYHLFFCGHLHRSESGTYKKMGGNRCLEETATGTMASGIYEDNAKYLIGFQMVDVDASGKIYTTPYTLENYVNFKPGRTEDDLLEDLQQNLEGMTVAHPLIYGSALFEILKHPAYLEVNYLPRSQDPDRNKMRVYMTSNINSLFSIVRNEAFACIRVSYKNDNDFALYNCILTIELMDGGDGDLSDTDIVKGIHAQRNGGPIVRGYKAEMRVGTINPHFTESFGLIYVHRRFKDRTATLHWELSSELGTTSGDEVITFNPIIRDSKTEYSDYKYETDYRDYMEEN